MRTPKYKYTGQMWTRPKYEVVKKRQSAMTYVDYLKKSDLKYKDLWIKTYERIKENMI